METRGPGVKVWGHRGWLRLHPDNSLAGIGAAFGVVDTVEIDVRQTADGRLVLAHDPTIGGLVISDSIWTTLSAIDIGGGHRPVLLDEALEAFPDRAFDIEIKFDPADADLEIAATVASMARPHDLVTSFYWPAVDEVRRSGTGDRPATGLLLDEPVPVETAIEHANALGHDWLAPSAAIVDADPDAVKTAIAADLRIVVWTVNDVADAITFAELGVSAIITDDPGALTTALGVDRPEPED